MYGVIEVICFDLDDTLYPEVNFYTEIINNSIYFNGIPRQRINDIVSLVVSSGAEDILGDILKSMNLYTVQRQEALFQACKFNNVKINIANNILKILKKLSHKYKLAILTNGVIEIQKNKIRSLKIDQIFDRIFYARDNGRQFEKPHPVAFNGVIEYFESLPERILFVGDQWTNDMIGAESAGMQTLFCRHYDPSQSDGKAEDSFCQSLEFFL